MAAGEVKGTLTGDRRLSPARSRAWGPESGSRVRGSGLRPGGARSPVCSSLLAPVLTPRTRGGGGPACSEFVALTAGGPVS